MGHKLAVRKNVKKPTSRAAQSARCAEFLKSRRERKLRSKSGVMGNLRDGIWRLAFARPFSVNMTLMSSKAVESEEHKS